MADIIDRIPQNAEQTYFTARVNPEKLNACIDDILSRLSKLEAAEVQPVDRWISVKDRLPDKCVEVLVYDTDCGVMMGWYFKDLGHFVTEFMKKLDTVTHWQPFPEPPKQ